MPESKPPAKIYQESLSNLRFGIPLWIPEPINHSVEIGDVGFFDQTGAWFRVFNILSSEDSTRAAPRAGAGFGDALRTRLQCEAIRSGAAEAAGRGRGLRACARVQV